MLAKLVTTLPHVVGLSAVFSKGNIANSCENGVIWLKKGTRRGVPGLANRRKEIVPQRICIY